MITQLELFKILSYNPYTGIFIWIVNLPNGIHIGDIAGSPHKLGYINIRIKGKTYLAHRLAWLYMTGKWPNPEIDHEDLNKVNNKWINLREATRQQNLFNKTVGKANKSSGIKGVTWHKRDKKWCAVIRLNTKLINIGQFEKLEEAVKARQEYAVKAHGEFVRETLT